MMFKVSFILSLTDTAT